MQNLFEECSPRVAELRKKVLGAPQICTERAALMTESYKQTEGEPFVFRRVKAMAHILQNMTIGIEDGEIIVARSTSKGRGGPLIPELQWKWYLNEIEDLSTRQWDRCAPISDAEKRIMRDCLPYWEGKTPVEHWLSNSNPVALKNQESGAFICMGGVAMHLAHTSVDYEKVLNEGLNSLIKEIDRELVTSTESDQDKKDYLQAAKITLDAMIRFAGRYADLAEKMAESEKDATRRKELLSIAEVCRHVPAHPARSFHEALQSMWFVNIGLRIEAPALGITFGRPDQFLYPFYESDIKKVVITREYARELIALTLVKMNDMAIVMGGDQVESLGGFPTMAGITIGGVTIDGKNAVNDLSHLILEAEVQVGLTVDEVIIRIGEDTEQEFIEKACEANKVLRGKLKFVSDYTVIRQLVAEGRPLEIARNYILAGCFTPTVPAVCFDTTAGSINGMLLLELALNNGMSRMSGERLGPATGDPRMFGSFDDVLDALRQQVQAVIEPGISLHRQYKELYTQFVPQPFHSILFDGCVQKGLDLANGLSAPYLREGYGLAGIVDMGDALAGLKLAVFDRKIVSMTELLDALDKNFDGYAPLHQFLKNAPKFGNDNEYVDELVNTVIDMVDVEMKKFRGYKGAELALAAATGTAHLMAGRTIGATPDGRKAGEPLAEGGISPHQGRNKSGITATFNSVARVNHVKLPAGSVFNMRINPSALKDETRVRKFASMLKTYCKRGGCHAQFNIVDGQMLREAQREPDKYRDLVVRVATYSAVFIELSKQLQDDIIERTEFEHL